MVLGVLFVWFDGVLLVSFDGCLCGLLCLLARAYCFVRLPEYYGVWFGLSLLFVMLLGCGDLCGLGFHCSLLFMLFTFFSSFLAFVLLLWVVYGLVLVGLIVWFGVFRLVFSLVVGGLCLFGVWRLLVVCWFDCFDVLWVGLIVDCWRLVYILFSYI